MLFLRFLLQLIFVNDPFCNAHSNANSTLARSKCAPGPERCPVGTTLLIQYTIRHVDRVLLSCREICAKGDGIGQCDFLQDNTNVCLESFDFDPFSVYRPLVISPSPAATTTPTSTSLVTQTTPTPRIPDPPMVTREDQRVSELPHSTPSPSSAHPIVSDAAIVIEPPDRETVEHNLARQIHYWIIIAISLAIVFVIIAAIGAVILIRRRRKKRTTVNDRYARDTRLAAAQNTLRQRPNDDINTESTRTDGTIYGETESTRTKEAKQSDANSTIESASKREKGEPELDVGETTSARITFDNRTTHRDTLETGASKTGETHTTDHTREGRKKSGTMEMSDLPSCTGVVTQSIREPSNSMRTSSIQKLV